MALNDFAKVFTRSFVIAYFVPCLAGLLAIRLTMGEANLLAGLEGSPEGTQLLTLGGLAVLAGVVLTGFKRPLMRALEGYPLRPSHGRYRDAVGARLIRRGQRRFDHLAAVLTDEQSDARTAAAIELFRRFPANRADVLPTGFGNAIRSFETHPRQRYGLDGVTLWPRVELLLSETERDVISNAETSVAFYVNSIAVILAVASLVTADTVRTADGLVASLADCALVVTVGCLLALGAYRTAVNAVAGWGDSVRAAFDLHRLEVYAKLGVRQPTSPDDEQIVARAVNRCLLYGEPIVEDLRARAE